MHCSTYEKENILKRAIPLHDTEVTDLYAAKGKVTDLYAAKGKVTDLYAAKGKGHWPLYLQVGELAPYRKCIVSTYEKEKILKRAIPLHNTEIIDLYAATWKVIDLWICRWGS